MSVNNRRSAFGSVSSDEPIDVLARRPRKRTSRVVDEKRFGKVRSYRGIPDDIDTALKEIANDLRVPLGEVVRAFLEHALHDYKNGELNLHPEPRIVQSEKNYTLYAKR